MMEKLKLLTTMAVGWIKARISERTTWDGSVMIAIALIFLLLKPVATFAAYAAIVYGIWTLVKKEKSTEE